MAGERTKRARGVLGGCWYMAVVALGVTLALEWFNQGTPAKVYAFLVGHPWMFLFNVEIVFNTFLLAELFRRRLGARLAIGMLWLALGFTNFMVQRTRVLPLTTRDVLLIPDGMKMITVYFSWIEIVGIFGGVALLIVAIVMLLVKTRRRARFNRLGSATLFLPGDGGDAGGGQGVGGVWPHRLGAHQPGRRLPQLRLCLRLYLHLCRLWH